MNLYYDSEFTGLHQNTSFISLAMVADDGQAFYAEFTDYDKSQCDDWIKQNVLAHTRWINQPVAATGQWQEEELTLCYGDSAAIKSALNDWLAPYQAIEIWADCPAWDWVLFCELFGGAFHIPRQIYYLPFDLVTLFKSRGVDPDTNRADFSGVASSGKQRQQHNALHDAQMLRGCYQKLMT